MPNQLLQRYRAALATQGVVDPRPDDDITTQLGQVAEQQNRGLFDQFPDFAQDYRDIREANAPSLAGEAGRALKAGTQELASTAAGVGALATGSDYLKEKAKSFAEDAAGNAPTVATLEDIAPGETNPVKKVLSKDALRYSIAKVAGSVPSLVETLGLATAGAAAGSAVEPGAGTIVGGAEGALEGFLGRGIVKSAIRRLLATQGEEMVAAKLIPAATETAVADAIRTGAPDLLKAVQTEASAIAARRAGTAANALNMYALNAGGLYNETDNRELAALGGAAGALPAIALPELVIHKLYPGVTKAVGQQLGSQYVTRLATEALKDAGVLGSAMALQETTNIIAKNIAAGKDATDISDDDWKRIREAAIGGALTGPLASPLTARGSEEAFNPAAAKARAEAARAAMAGRAAAVTPEAASMAPAAEEQPASMPPARRVALMSDAERATRFADLETRKGTLTPDEQQELTLLQAFVGEKEAPAAPEATTEAPPEQPVPVAQTPPEQVAPEPSPLSAVAEPPATAPGTETPAAVEPATANPENPPQLLAPARESAAPAPVAREPVPGAEVAPAPIEPSAAAPAVPAAELPNPTVAGAAAVSAPEAPPSVPESPNLEQRLRAELQRPPGFAFGKVNEGAGTLDLRDDPRFDTLTPEMAKKLPVEGALDEGGNRAKTRVAVVLEAPDGHYVKAGLLVPQEMAKVGGAGERDNGPAVQMMARETRKGGEYQKLLKEGGNRPALLSDVIAAGYKLRALIHFDEAPGNIFQRFDSRATYDAAYAATEKSNGTAAAKTIPTRSAAEGVERRNVLDKRGAIERKVEALGKELATADPARAAEINDEIKQLYRDLSRLPEPKLMTAFHGTPHTVDEFDTAHIGNGEGAQTYGWGLYFAQNPEVAKKYQENLAPGKGGTPIDTAARILKAVGGDKAKALAELESRRKSATMPRAKEHFDEVEKAIRSGRAQGNLYTVDIADETIAKMLDWDAPLNKIPESILNDPIVKAALEADSYGTRSEYAGTGGAVYEALAKYLGVPTRQVVSWAPEGSKIADDKAASLHLKSIGVPGIKYLDQGSRAPGQGTRNFVVFDGKTAKILEENGNPRIGPDAKLMTAAPDAKPPVAVESDRTNQFAAAAARIRQAGAKTDVFARTFLQASVADELTRRIAALQDRWAAATPERQAQIQPEIERLQKQLDAVEHVRGVAYSPWHIAVGLEDVQNQNVADLVALLHEGGHAMLARDPVMQGRVTRAVDATMAELQAKLGALQEQTGVRELNTTDPEELIVSTLAQKLATEGIPDSPSLARAVVQWVKDLYYRIAMAVQSAFGREPDGQLALDWFENQMRRVVGGDYDYRFANIFDRYSPEPTVEQLHRNEPAGGTPTNLADFYDPLTGRVSQPSVIADTADAVRWNLKFMTDDGSNVGKELDIPFREAKARIMGAAINEEAELAERMFGELKQEGMTFDQFWATVGRGDTPKTRLGEIESAMKDAGAARIGGDRMTEAMNQQARVEAKRLIQKWQWKNIRRIASDEERSAKAEAGLVDQAKLVNKIEGDLRNAAMHEATLGDKLKEMIRDMAKGMRRGLDTAFASGELAQAVREAEDLAERDPIPKEYQNVFKAVLADEVPIFQYVEAIAKLDMPLHEMTRPEIIAAIRDNAAGDAALDRLTQPKNKPLLVALTALAKKNAEQLDLIQLRAVKDPARYLAIKADLDAIRNANKEQLKQISATIRDSKKAATFADRIKRNYVQKRDKLRRMQDTIQEAEDRRKLLTKANALIGTKLEDMETSGATAPSEWTPAEGAKWLAMQETPNGTWKAAERTLSFTPEGPAVNAEQVRSDLVQNRQWLAANKAKAGSKLYEMVKRQTLELQGLDLQQRYPEGWRHLLDKMIQPLGQAFGMAGHSAGARIQQMLNNFQFINKSYWHGDLENRSLEWTAALRKVEEASGIKDHGAFFSQIYDPVLYYIQTEPGREEGPALREAVRAARKRLPGEAAANFDDVFKDFLRKTKDVSERYVQIAEQHGAFVKDQRLGGELRRAVAQGYLTVMRRVNSSLVSAITRDMQNAGWKLQIDGDGKQRRIVRAGTFDALMPDLAKDEADAQARTQVLENPDTFSKAISGFFTPNIVRTWLEPFVNKPGEPVFRYHGETIDQMDVQQAWQDSAGKVGDFIDALGKQVGLTAETNADGEMVESQLSPEAEFRASMLRQIDHLFLMESRMAYDSAQTKNLFDPMGPKPHVVMDARLNELIPPEHLQHAVFDPLSSKNLLATLAFHGAFGRNGERMTRALDELKSNLSARKNEFDSLTSTTEAGRKAEAEQRGINYAEAKRGAKIYHDVTGLQEALKAQFGFNQQAGVLGDMRTGLEMLHFVTGQTVNNPKTALLNMLQPAQRALVQRSLGSLQARTTGLAYAEIAKQVFGSILENFGLHVLRASEHARDIGAVEGQGYGNLPWSVVMSDIGKRGRFQESAIDKWAIRPLRQIAAAQRKGVRVGLGTPEEFPRLNVVPGVGGVMNYLSTVAATANGRAEVWALERVVKAGMDYFAAHPEKMNDPAFRLSAADLGLKNRAWFSDEGSFDYYRRKSVEYGVGNLEDIVRGAMERQTRGEQLLTRDQALRVAMLANNELDLQASLNTRPAGWSTNPILKFGLPLLGWPIAQMNQVHQALKTVEGRASWMAALKGLGIMAAWSLPAGLAFTLMTDEYDDKVLKKKSNLASIDPIAAAPIVGPALALAAGDKGLANLHGILERMSRAGNIYGVGADAVAQTLSSIDPTSGQRPFSLDQRVLVFSQFLNLQQAVSNWINQGGAATYASVERPLIMAIGGNGALHAVDIFNGLLGLDNQEARIVQRTNAGQWLRAAGRDIGLELRASGGGSVAPTAVSVWIREMQLAAFASDRLNFLDAYRRAVDAAREEGKPNPEQFVIDGWKSRDPLDVFRQRPTEFDLARLKSVMSDNGREAVSDALRLYQQYSELIAMTPADRYEHRVLSQQTRVPNINTLRAQMAGGALSFR